MGTFPHGRLPGWPQLAVSGGFPGVLPLPHGGQALPGIWTRLWKERLLPLAWMATLLCADAGCPVKWFLLLLQGQMVCVPPSSRSSGYSCTLFLRVGRRLLTHALSWFYVAADHLGRSSIAGDSRRPILLVRPVEQSSKVSSDPSVSGEHFVSKLPPWLPTQQPCADLLLLPLRRPPLLPSSARGGEACCHSRNRHDEIEQIPLVPWGLWRCG